MPRQLDHSDHAHNGIQSPLSLLLDDISDPLNVGSIFRIADAMAVNRLYLCGTTATPPDSKLKKTARSCDQHVDYQQCDNAVAVLDRLDQQSVKLLALEITDTSIAIGSNQFDALVQPGEATCLLLGSESGGINNNLLDKVHACVHIPMLGVNSSMNVASATSIACFELNRLLLTGSNMLA